MKRPITFAVAASIALALEASCRSDVTAREPALGAGAVADASPAPSAPAEPAPQGRRQRDPAAATDAQPFLTADRCAVCHNQSSRAAALTTASGDDASPHGTWQATAMANAFRDPYWRAQMSREIETSSGAKREIETLCLRCHAPAASHTTRLAEQPAPTIEAAEHDALAVDGVNCTVCHRATSEGLGTPASFDGRLAIRGDATIYGPFENPAPGPMRMHTGYTPTFGEHVSRSALCGACHTLTTKAGDDAPPFLEQAVYLEWRNSVFSDETTRTNDSRTCQECHMADVGSMRIAHNPAGFDFNIRVRDEVRAHAMVGGNALLIDLLRENAQELGVTASEGALKRVAAAARAQLAHATARITISGLERKPGRLRFDVRVENLAGHKLPSGYPARRAWLDVEVREGRTTLFESGAIDDQGRLVGVADELALPHFDRIEKPEQVQVYEMRAADGSGAHTTLLTRMTRHTKDNRILPRGWKPDGPHAADTRPVGTDGDLDFADGADVVTYDIALPETAGDVLVIAQLQYQAIPPAWAASLSNSKTPESARFLAMYAKAKDRTENIATTTASVSAR